MPISYDKEKSQTSVIRVESLLLGTSTFVNVVLSAALCLGFGLAFSYEELQEATNGFTEELGKGVFGVVSKGDANWFWCRSGGEEAKLCYARCRGVQNRTECN
ncbi:hypothetical protein ACFX2C_028857 [Malus domestica]